MTESGETKSKLASTSLTTLETVCFRSCMFFESMTITLIFGFGEPGGEGDDSVVVSSFDNSRYETTELGKDMFESARKSEIFPGRRDI